MSLFEPEFYNPASGWEKGRSRRMCRKHAGASCVTTDPTTEGLETMPPRACGGLMFSSVNLTSSRIHFAIRPLIIDFAKSSENYTASDHECHKNRNAVSTLEAFRCQTNFLQRVGKNPRVAFWSCGWWTYPPKYLPIHWIMRSPLRIQSPERVRSRASDIR